MTISNAETGAGWRRPLSISRYQETRELGCPRRLLGRARYSDPSRVKFSPSPQSAPSPPLSRSCMLRRLPMCPLPLSESEVHLLLPPAKFTNVSI